MSLMDFLQDMLPESWLNDVRMNYGETLTDEMIVNSVQQASVFFNMDNPMAIAEDWTTGVYPNMDISPKDDVLIFNREQLVGMGITEQEGLSLVMTHECTHRALQGMNHLGFDSHQEELCCDFMAGVRAGLNGIDVSQMENSLAETPMSDTHPGGADRVDSIEKGIKFAQEYLAAYDVAPTFSNCLAYFTGNADLTDLAPKAQITLRPEHPTSVFINHESRETPGNIVCVNDNADTLKGYTQSEINAHINKAEDEMEYWKAQMRRHGELAENEMWRESEISHMKSAEHKYETAKAEYKKWKEMKPDDLKGFTFNAELHAQQSQNQFDMDSSSNSNDFGKPLSTSSQEQISSIITEDNESRLTFKGINPPNYEKDGYIPKGTVRLERTVSGQKEIFDLYVKKGEEYIYEDGKWIRIDGSGTIKVNNIKYDKI